VEGAEVALYEEIRDPSTDRDVVQLQDEIRRTDAEGRFAFTAEVAPSYRVFLVARKEGLALGWDVLMQSADNVIVLERPCRLGGVVVDARGRGVGGAKVRAVAKSSYLQRLEQRPILGPERWLTVETDRHGRFRFDDFAADVSAVLWVKAPGRVQIYTYTPHWVAVCGFETGRTDLRLVLPDEVAVRGRVVDARGGAPVPDARLIIHPHGIRDDRVNPYLPAHTTSKSDGRFVFAGVPPGRHDIDVSAPYETGLVDRRVRFEVQPEQGDAEITATLAGGGTIEIVACEEATHQPIRALTVYFSKAGQDEPSSFYKDAQTGSDGILRIRAPAGLCKFSTRRDGYVPWQYEDQVSVKAGQTAKAQITLRRYPQVTGLVVDESGRSVGGAKVNDSVTDSAGRFEVPFPSEESLFGGRLIVRHPGENLATIAQAADDGGPMRITLRRALTVSGRIVDPNGRGIPAARVALHIRAEGALTPYGREILTDSQGRYEMKGVIPGRAAFDHRISVNVSGYGIRQYSRMAVEGGPGTRVELDPIVLLPADQTVTGVVVDAEGHPAVGVPIAVHGANQPARYLATDKDGRFVVRRVCKGPLRIQAVFSSVREQYGVLQAEGGDRDVTVVIGRDGVHSRTPSLVGKPLPDRGEFDSGLSPVDGEGRMLLLCFFDAQQRPSRNRIAELAKRVEQFSRMGVALLGIQASKMDPAELNTWIADNHVAFPVRMIPADAETLRRTWGVQSLPWLILIDRARVVRVEGAQLAEVERQIEKMVKGER
jgi:protocatechuate 3,4-dioxygenase beta subunit